MPGTYKVSMSKFEDGVYTELVAPTAFKTVALNNASLPLGDRKQLDQFSRKAAELRRATSAASSYYSQLVNKLRYIKPVLIETAGIPPATTKEVYDIEKRLNSVSIQLNGDATLSRREFETLPSINERIQTITGALWRTTAAAPNAFIQSYELAAKQFEPVLNELKSIGDAISKLEAELEKQGAPYTPGRVPAWKKN